MLRFIIDLLAALADGITRNGYDPSPVDKKE